MRSSRIKCQKKLVAGLTRKRFSVQPVLIPPRAHGEATRRGKATQGQPSPEQGGVKGGKKAGRVKVRRGKNIQRTSPKTIQKPIRHDIDPATRGLQETTDPLDQQRAHLKSHADHPITSQLLRVKHYFSGNEVTFARPEKRKNPGVKLQEDPRRHGDKGSDVPNTRERARALIMTAFP